MKYPVGDRILTINGLHSFLLVARAGHSFDLCIESCTGEIFQAVEPDDLVVVSAPEGGAVEPAVFLLQLVKNYHMPLLVLPRDHPGAGRLTLLVSVAGKILTSCTIRRGTHPDQHLLCSSEELAGILLRGEEGAVVVENLPSSSTIDYLQDLRRQNKQ
jgi:hypothetical protein